MKLSTWNWLAAAAQGAAGVGIGIWFLVQKGDINFNTDLYNFHINLNNDNPSESNVYATKAVAISGILMKILIVVYFAFTTFFHIFYATDGFGSGAYTRALSHKNNYFRWIEYAISSTIMTFLLAIICGVKSLDAVILLLVMNVGMILCGQIIEAAGGPNAYNIKVVATAIGWILIAGIIAILFKAFFMALADGKANDYKVPTWVYFVIFPLVIWYASFGFVSLWGAFGKDQSLSKYLKVEKAYILLSLFSKLNLGFVVGFGLTRPKAEEN